MLEQLAIEAKEARIAACRTQIEIATAAGVSHVVISNFERAVRWPRQLDSVIAAYERECGLAAGDLWRRGAAR